MLALCGLLVRSHCAGARVRSVHGHHIYAKTDVLKINKSAAFHGKLVQKVVVLTSVVQKV